MSRESKLTAGVAVALALAAAAWWLSPVTQAPTAPEVPPPLAPPRGAAAAPEAVEPPRSAAAPAAEAPPAGDTQADDEQDAAARADLPLYASRPMSPIPHRVLLGWGATGERKQLGQVGAVVVVDPGVSDHELERLCRDIRDYHRGASALSVRVVDSEEAATYDRHSDGGELWEQHQVAIVSVNPKTETDAIRVRGRWIIP